MLEASAAMHAVVARCSHTTPRPDHAVASLAISVSDSLPSSKAHEIIAHFRAPTAVDWRI